MWQGPRGSEKLKTHLKSLGKLELLDQLSVSDCVVVAKGSLQFGFTQAGCEDIWKKIDSSTRSLAPNGKDFNGLPFFQVLRFVGWRTYYWCPSSSPTEIQLWDVEDTKNLGKGQNSAKGDHQWWYSRVVRENLNYESLFVLA